MTKLSQNYIIVNRTEYSAKRQKRPVQELIEAPSDLRKVKKLARKLSGDVCDVSFIVNKTDYLRKGGEQRIYPKLGKVI